MIVGGGLAGMACAAALGSDGFEVDLHEAKPFLGGRATSYPLAPSDPDSEHIDNCQHVTLRCCTALMDFYERCGVADKIAFDERLYFVQPGGTTDVLKRGRLPYPLHLSGAMLGMQALRLADKLSVARTLWAMRRERKRSDLDSINMGAWLAARGATPNAYNRFWRPILVSALNEEPERSAAAPAFQVFLEGMLGSRTSYEMGLPRVPLGELYSDAFARGLSVNVHLRSAVEQIDPEDAAYDFYVSAVPFERVGTLAPRLALELEAFEHSPITGVHLWFDRPVMDLPHAVLLDRTLQWVFRKSERYLLGVVSASRGWLQSTREAIIETAVHELEEYFPAVGRAKLERAHVVKEVRATYSVKPGLEAERPLPRTRYSNVFLAGDWVKTGWPATMEGAVRSGYAAAEAVAEAAGRPRQYLPNGQR